MQKNIDLKKVVAINDLCGCGSCSLKIILPVLAAAGLDCLSCPTAILSAHTAYPAYSFHDMTTELSNYFESWQRLEMDIAAIYSGFLGSVDQIDIISKFIDRQTKTLILIDPVMGDHGEAYKTYTPEMCMLMRKLAGKADILTPNLTEAALLLNEPYGNREIDEEQAKVLCHKLHDLGAKNIVLKGVRGPSKQIINYVSQANGDWNFIAKPEINCSVFGSGDFFASLLLASFLRGHSLVEACDFAADLTGRAIELSQYYPDHRRRGICCEFFLGEIAAKFVK